MYMYTYMHVVYMVFLYSSLSKVNSGDMTYM